MTNILLYDFLVLQSLAVVLLWEFKTEVFLFVLGTTCGAGASRSVLIRSQVLSHGHRLLLTIFTTIILLLLNHTNRDGVVLGFGYGRSSAITRVARASEVIKDLISFFSLQILLVFIILLFIELAPTKHLLLLLLLLVMLLLLITIILSHVILEQQLVFHLELARLLAV